MDANTSARLGQSLVAELRYWMIPFAEPYDIGTLLTVIGALERRVQELEDRLQLVANRKPKRK